MRLNWISCIAPSLPCHAYHLHHVGSSVVVVRLHPMCVPAFASSRIGSRIGVVRYDKLSGCPSASFNRQAFPKLLSLQESLTYFILPSPLLLSLSCVLVTCPIHLLPQAAHIATTTSYSYCLVLESALRVVVHASAVYISLSLLLSYRVICWGIMTHGLWICCWR